MNLTSLVSPNDKYLRDLTSVRTLLHHQRLSINVTIVITFSTPVPLV